VEIRLDDPLALRNANLTLPDLSRAVWSFDDTRLSIDVAARIRGIFEDARDGVPPSITPRDSTRHPARKLDSVLPKVPNEAAAAAQPKEGGPHHFDDLADAIVFGLDVGSVPGLEESDGATGRFESGRGLLTPGFSAQADSHAVLMHSSATENGRCERRIGIAEVVNREPDDEEHVVDACGVGEHRLVEFIPRDSVEREGNDCTESPTTHVAQESIKLFPASWFVG